MQKSTAVNKNFSTISGKYQHPAFCICHKNKRRHEPDARSASATFGKFPVGSYNYVAESGIRVSELCIILKITGVSGECGHQFRSINAVDVDETGHFGYAVSEPVESLQIIFPDDVARIDDALRSDNSFQQSVPGRLEYGTDRLVRRPSAQQKIDKDISIKKNFSLHKPKNLKCIQEYEKVSGPTLYLPGAAS